MCNKSESISNLAAALVAFSGEVKSIEKDGKNPHFKSQYTTLDHMIDETKPLLTKNGLTVMQFPGGDGEKVTMRTMILHSSGEWIESEPLTLRPTKNDPQGAGSAITYARRYSYAAALSLSLGDDDDGNEASKPQEYRQTSQNAAPQAQAYPTNRTSQPAASASTGQSAALNNKSRALHLMNEMRWDWNALGEFASDVLGRRIGKVLKDIHTEEEWKKVADNMEISRAAS